MRNANHYRVELPPLAWEDTVPLCHVPNTPLPLVAFVDISHWDIACAAMRARDLREGKGLDVVLV